MKFYCFLLGLFSSYFFSFVRMTISSEVTVHQISFEHRVVNINYVAGRSY